MTNPLGFTLEETDDGRYILRQTVDGQVNEIRMNPEEFDQLKATVVLWNDRRLSGYRDAAGGAVRPIVVHQVEQAVLWPDEIGASVLLNVVGPSGHYMTLALPRDVASHMAAALPQVLEMMPNLTKQ
jgi:hypothetical protein